MPLKQEQIKILDKQLCLHCAYIDSDPYRIWNSNL